MENIDIPENMLDELQKICDEYTEQANENINRTDYKTLLALCKLLEECYPDVAQITASPSREEVQAQIKKYEEVLLKHIRDPDKGIRHVLAVLIEKMTDPVYLKEISEIAEPDLKTEQKE